MEWIKKKSPHFSRILLAPARAIFGKTNSEMTNVMTSPMHLYEVYEEEQEGRIYSSKNTTGDKRKNVVATFKYIYIYIYIYI